MLPHVGHAWHRCSLFANCTAQGSSHRGECWQDATFSTSNDDFLHFEAGFSRSFHLNELIVGGQVQFK